MAIDLANVHPIILAGGFGTRLRRVVADVPKPMIRVEGKPFVEWIIRWLAKAGFRSATLSTFHQADQFERYFEDDPVEGVAVHCVREPSPMGTGGAVVYAISQLTHRAQAWLVLNGDSMALFSLHSLLQKFTGNAAIVGREVDDASRYGTLAIDEQDQLLSFREKSADPSEPGLINAGIYLLGDRLLAPLQIKASSMEHDLMPGWLKQGTRIDVLRTDAPFIDIGTEQTLAEAGEFIRQNRQALA